MIRGQVFVLFLLKVHLRAGGQYKIKEENDEILFKFISYNISNDKFDNINNKNKNELLSNKLNLVISISLFICIIILSVITVSFGLKLSD